MDRSPQVCSPTAPAVRGASGPPRGCADLKNAMIALERRFCSFVEEVERMPPHVSLLSLRFLRETLRRDMQRLEDDIRRLRAVIVQAQSAEARVLSRGPPAFPVLSLPGDCPSPQRLPIPPPSRPPPIHATRPERRRDRRPCPRACEHCGVRETPEWRRGPLGPDTLCNACGLKYARSLRRDRDSDTRSRVREKMAVRNLLTLEVEIEARQESGVSDDERKAKRRRLEKEQE